MNSGDTAWVLICGALVLFMTPGLAIFYGGMVRTKSTLNMMMMSFSAIGVTTIIWSLYGYSLAFGEGGAFIGDLKHLGLAGTLNKLIGPDGHQIPVLAFTMFQLTFAVITIALLSGTIADRAKFSAWLIFVALWVTFVYTPIAHAAFTSNGFFAKNLGALDFAGGTVVEINSGAAALALALVLGKRDGFKRDPMRPHNMPLVLLGAGMLWFGWFGFNAGSALQASSLAASAMINTQIATACASLSWIIVEKLREGSATTLGIASGAIAGAVAITPACGFVNPIGALVIGLIAGATSAWAVTKKFKWGYDDSLDVVGVHGVGGFVGMIGIGILATKLVNDAGRDGLFRSGKFDLLFNQLTASVLTALYSFCVTFLIAYLIKKTIGFRVAREVEITGLDTSIHAESAYDVGIYTAR